MKKSGLWEYIALILVVLVGPVSASDKVIYVDGDAPGPVQTGSNWSYAYKHIQDALTEADLSVKPVEIRVAAGIYRPDETSTHPNGTGDRSAIFQLINGVILKGGYAGYGQSNPDARDITVYKTILSGDLDGNDVPVADPCDLLTEPTRAENSYNVVIGGGAGAAAILDGFVITGGNATGDGSGHPYNRTYFGGGMCNYTGSPTINSCTFNGNSADYIGGGMCNYTGSPMVSNCTFNGNSSRFGGGMENYVISNPTLIECTFHGNFAKVNGGGMENSPNCNPTLINCTFIDNFATSGGGIYNYHNSPTLTNALFAANTSTYQGGGMYNYQANPVLVGCVFRGNSTERNGGCMFNYESNPTISNCIFTENWGGWEGGGMLNTYNSLPTITNCTFSGNGAKFYGGVLCNYENSMPTLKNCILWGNTAPCGAQIYCFLTSSTIVSYSDIQGGWDGLGNINVDPCFVDINNEDFHLKSEACRWDPASESWIIDNTTSPCIDTGDFASDWRAELCPHGCRINMGAYGGTPEASMSLWDAGSIADVDVDGRIDGNDMKLIIGKWLFEEFLLPEDLNRDGIVNFTDFAIFAYARGLPSPASNPSPADGAIVVSTSADLSWTASAYAISHDMYFGAINPPPFIVNQATTVFDPGEMAYSTTYYWRIDEISDAGKTNGLVWSFTTMSSPPPSPPF